ncbi:MAG: hypothetical protein QOC96_2854 [Acidobacteriota bacterium]|jgi:hypothetical protein|nr:hypothetical protein [Acidobacteriota bacterium]
MEDNFSGGWVKETVTKVNQDLIRIAIHLSKDDSAA